jgi:hypothetical protein
MDKGQGRCHPRKGDEMNARELADWLDCHYTHIARALRELAEREEAKGETPETDAILSNQVFSDLDEATDCLNQWVDFSRSLERRLRECQNRLHDRNKPSCLF